MRQLTRNKTLFFREWVAIASVLGFFGVIILVGKAGEIRSKRIVRNQTSPLEMMIEVELLGAVKNPGTYTCKAGILLGELLKEVGIQEDANKKKIAFKKVLFSSQTIEISSKKVL